MMKKEWVMLSAAKHPQWLFRTRQLQILRFARNERTVGRHPDNAE
jgi:hypothetical protein